MFKKILAIILAEVMVLGQVVVLLPLPAYAANESFVQTDWSGGASSTVAVDPANQTGWNKYSSKDSNISTPAGSVTLSASTGTVVETADVDFENGTLSNLETTGSGAIKLSNDTNDALRPTLGQWGAPAPIPYSPGYGSSSCYTSGNYIYVLWGNFSKQFSRYDVSAKTWTPMAPTPRGVYYGADLAYPGSGDYIYALRGYGSKDFWRYSISTNTWESLADTLASVYYGGSLVAYDANTLYATRGWNTNTFWKYTISTDTWQERATAPGGFYYGAQLCYPGSGSYIYVLRGNGTTFYRYDVGNTWTTLTSSAVPYSVSEGSDLVAGGDGYLYASLGSVESWMFYRYSITGESWSQLPSFPFIPSYGCSMTRDTTNNKIYATAGYNVNTTYMPGFDISTQLWDSFGGPGRHDRQGTGYVKAGNYIFSVGNTQDSNSANYARFYRFDLTTEQWEDMGPLPITNYVTSWPRASQLLYTGSGDYLYWLSVRGTDINKLYRYSISGNSWEHLSTCPVTLQSDAEMFYSGSGDTVYVLAGSTSSYFYKYSISGNSWTPAATTPAAVGNYHGNMVQVGTNIYLCRGQNYNTFWRYSTGGDSWAPMTNITVNFYRPNYFQGGTNAGAALVYPGSGNDIYLNVGNGASFYKYTINAGTGTWTSVGFPFSGGNYHGMYYPGGGTDKIYISQGQNSQFYEFSISGGDFTKLADRPTYGSGDWMWKDPAGDVLYYFTYTNGFPMFYKYTVSTDTWTYPCFDPYSRDYGFGYGGAAVRVGDYIYGMLGYWSRQFYRYSLADDSWEVMAYIPNIVYTGGSLTYPASGGDYIYATTGAESKNFLRYSISTNTWSKLADTPENITTGSCMSAPGDGAVYLLRGGNYNNFYKYSISGNSWVSLNSAAVNCYNGSQMIYPGSGSYIYVLLGYNSNENFYQYNFGSDEWTKVAAYPGGSASTTYNRGYPSFATDGSNIYVLDGYYTSNLSKYSIGTNTWTTLANSPGAMYAGCQLVWGGPNYPDFLYGYKGSERSNGFEGFKYSISQNQWDGPPYFDPADFQKYAWSAYCRMTPVKYNGQNYLYVFGRDYNSSWSWTHVFYRLNLDTGVWQQRTEPPQLLYGNSGGDIYYPGSGDYIYALRGNQNSDFYRYSISTDTWENLESTQLGIDSGGRLAKGNDGYIYATRGWNSTFVYRYNIGDGHWYSTTPVPLNVTYGASLLYHNGYLYLLRGGAVTDNFYRMQVSNQQWNAMSDIPAVVSYGGGLSYPGIGDYIYAVDGQGRRLMRYSITGDSWEELNFLPNEQHYNGDFVYGGDGYFYLLEGYRNGQMYLRKYNVFAKGEYTSAVLEAGKNTGFGTADWTSTADNATTIANVKIRSSDSPTMSGASDFTEATDGADISGLSAVTDKEKYLQYKVELFTSDLGTRPEFRDMTMQYLYYPHDATLTSSVYDTTALRNRLMQLSWSETLLGNTDLRFQLRTSADNLTWSDWLGPTGTSSLVNNFSTADDYAMSSRVTVDSGSARITRELEDFDYKQEIKLDNTSGTAKSNIITTVTIPSTFGSFWDTVRSDGGDIRFHDGTQKIGYYLEKWDYTNRQAIIRVKVPSISAGVVKSIYLLYGSDAATSESSSSNAGFDMYQDFAGTTIDTGGTGFTVTEGGGTITQNDELLLKNNDSGWDTAVITNAAYTRVDGKSLIFKFKMQNGGSTMIGWHDSGTAATYGNYPYCIYVDNTNLRVYEDGSSRGTFATINNDVWYELKITLKSTGATYYFRPYGSDLWILLYDGSYSSESFLKPGLVVNSAYNNYTDDWRIETASNFFSGAVTLPNTEETTTSPTLGANWPYRETVTISNSGSALTNYQVKLEIDPGHAGFWSHVQNDGDDIRVVDANNTTVLSHCLTEFSYANQTAMVWVKVPSIPAGTKSIYLYYGNAAASSTSSGSDTFLFYDDFSGASLDTGKWQGSTGSVVVSGGEARIAGNGVAIYSKTDLGQNTRAATRFRSTNSTGNLDAGIGLCMQAATTGYLAVIDAYNARYSGLVAPGWQTYKAYFNQSIASTTPYLEIRKLDSGNGFSAYWKDVGTISSSDSSYTSGYAGIFNDNDSSGNYAYHDYFLVAKYVNDDPVVSFAFAPQANDYAITGIYYTTNPTIQPILGVFYNDNLSEFQETATKTSSEIKYQCSNNGYEWYWWNGSIWAAVTGGYSEANTATEVNAHLAEFMSEIASSGEFIYRAYLHSNSGTTTPYLDNIAINVNSATTYFLNYTGSEGINSSHTDAVSDRYFQYRAMLYSSGENAPILSDLTMQYVTAYLTITSPVGGEEWAIGSQHNITWDKDGLTNVANGALAETVKIEYYNGTDWVTEAAAAPNTGTYAWTVDNAHTPNARVRISSNGWPVITTTSPADFRIIGSVNLTAPDGAERWLVGTSQNITWSSSGAGQIPLVKLEYSRDSGGSWSSVIESEGTANDGIVTNDGTFSWTIPDEITSASTCLVRVSDSVDADTNDTSAAGFRIIGALEITAPTLNQSYVSGANYNVTWNDTGTMSQVDLLYTIDGATWRDMAGAVGQVTTVDNAGTYSWTVPNYLSETCLVKVRDHNDSTVYDDSPNFYIRGFQISSPNGAEEWELNYTHTITWILGGEVTPPLDIYLSTDGGGSYPYNLGRRTTATTSWDWNITGSDRFGVAYSPSDTCRIKIIDAESRSDTSNSDFKVLYNPAITVTAPTSSDEWIVGTDHDITWSTVGNVSSNLAIEYSVDGGAWTSVDPAPTAEQITAQSYSWEAQDAISEDVQIRIRETSVPQGRDTQSMVSDTSETFKIIIPNISITAPTAGTIWVVGDTSRTITWSSTGTLLDNLKLEYSVDSGSSWTEIANFTQAAHNGSYDWEDIPAEAAGEPVLLRISDSRTPTAVSDISDEITILGHQRLTITAPTAGLTLIQGDEYTITWDWDGQATTENLTLRLSIDGGATWPDLAPYLIETQVPNTPTSYPWVIPSNIETDQARIRIYDPSDAQVDYTTGDFTITIPSLTVTAPEEANNWFAKGTYNITWSTIGSVSNSLKIEYRTSSDGGSNWGGWQTLVAATTPAQAAAKSYAWTLPDSAGSVGQVRITDNNRTAVTHTSGTFNFVPSTVSITAPTGSETGPNAWVVGTLHNISWSTTGGAVDAISGLRIQYSKNGAGGPFTNVALIEDLETLRADSGSYSWTIPAEGVSTNVVVKIFDIERPATTATSNVFEIKPPSLTVTSPNDGTESWIIGTDHDITWYSVGAVTDPLKLYYTANGVNWVQINDFDGTNDGSYTWTVANAYSPGLAKIKIEDSYGTPRTDTSDLSFTIAYPTIAVDTPQELWSATDTKTVTWTPTGTLVGPNLKLEWSTDNFVTPNLISNTIPVGDTSYNWTVPETAVSTTVRLRVTDLGRTQTNGRSDNFTVLPVPVITISSPTDGEIGASAWRIGKEYTISWSDNGGAISNDLKLQYSVDNGSTWTDIATGEANDGSYSWTVPSGAEASTEALVRIYDNTPWKSATNLSVDSDVFEIAIPIITLGTPTAGTTWAVGDSAPITWTTEGLINDDLTLQYSVDDGENWGPVAAGQANDGLYTWTVPDTTPTSTAQIKIIDASSDYGGVQVEDTSENFNIISNPTMTVSAPNGGEVYVLGDTLPVRWSSQGLQIENVKIEYSANNFSSSVTIVESTPNDGVYDWVLPEDALSGATIKVRVSMVGNASINDVSDSNFRIRGGFTITSPASAGERRIVGKTEAFTWDTRGTIANVKVMYSATGAAPWTTIISSATNTGSYSFAIPAPRVETATAKIRIEDASDDTVYAESLGFLSDYYTITWRVLDYDTNAPLQLLSVRDDFWTDQTKTLTSPVEHDYPYGTYTTFWSKDGYIERSTEWTSDSDKTMSTALENQLTAMVEWHVLLSTSYNADTDTLKASTWLERRGKLVGTVESDLTDLESATVDIYDGETLVKSMTTATHDNSGVFWFSWENSLLEAGKTYFVKATISYRGSSYISGASVDVTSSKKIQETKTLLQAEALKTSAIKTAVESSLPAAISSARSSLETAVDAAKTEIKADTASILTATETTIPAKITEAKSQLTDITKSEILNRENTIRQGQTLTVRYRTHSGLAPVMDVYDDKNVRRISSQAMAEISGTGVYEYDVKFLNAWGRGDFTVVCSEASKGTMDAMTITVLKTDMDQVYGQVSAILGTTAGITGLKSVADTLNSQFNIIETALSKVGKDLVKEVKDAASSATALESVYTQLSSVAKQIKELSGSSGVNLEKLYQVSADKKTDMDYLKNKTQELKAAMEMNQKMVDNMANKPITQTWYEYK